MGGPVTFVDRLTARVHPRLLGPLGTLLVTARRREPCLVRAAEGGWIHRYREGIAVHPRLGGPSARLQDRRARDDFLHGYEPKAGDVIFDVGAGVGGEVRLFSRLVSPGGRVVSVEANPRTFALLARTVALNRLDNVTPLQVAMTGVREMVYISDDVTEHLANAITPDAGAGVAVQGLTLGDVMELSAVDHIDLLKMNIEGSELAVLSGARPCLGAVHNVAIACHDFLADRGGPAWQRTYQSVTELLHEEGFRLHSRPADPRPWVRYHVYGSR
jgi:FkbM family methyltransferase